MVNIEGKETEEILSEAQESEQERKEEEEGKEQPEQSLEEKQQNFKLLDVRVAEDTHLIEGCEDSIAEYENKRGEMGLPPDKDAEVYKDKERIEERRLELEDEKDEWVEENGMDNVPEGVVVNVGEDGRRENLLQKENEKDVEGKEERQKFVEEWRDGAIKHFSKTLKDDWRTSDAKNLKLCVKTVEDRLPKIFDNNEKVKGYVNGKSDELPQCVWMEWKTSSLFERASDKPNNIKELKLYFDDVSVTIAKKSELIKDEKKEGELESGEERGESEFEEEDESKDEEKPEEKEEKKK